MNNPMMQMFQARLTQLANTDPRVRQTMTMLQGKSPAEQQQMFFNMCKEQGLDPRQFAGQFGIRLK